MTSNDSSPNQINDSITGDSNSINLKKEISYYLFFWPWFLLSFIVLTASAFLYLRYETPIYETTAQLQIKDSKNKASSFLTGGADLFGFDKSNIQNEISVISSNTMLSRVSDRLDLQTVVYKLGRINSSLVSKGKYPFEISFKNPDLNQSLQIESINNEVIINKGNLSYVITKSQDSLDTNDFFIRIKDKDIFNSDVSFEIFRLYQKNIVSGLKNNLVVSAPNQRGDIVNLKLKGPNRDLNEEIVNKLINVVSEDQVFDKQEVSLVSINFIDQRLKSLSNEIDSLSAQTIKFKTQNQIFNSELQTQNAISNISQSQNKELELKIQLAIAKSLKAGLTDQSELKLLPFNIGINNTSVSELVSKYNEIFIERKSLLNSASPNNPVIIDLNNKLINTKIAINDAVNRYIKNILISIDSNDQRLNKTNILISDFPNKENTLNTYSRNFNILEELYVFLLQRKEEASISYKSALPNLKLLSVASSKDIPISPLYSAVYSSAVIVSILLPLLILFLLKVLDTKLNTRSDLEKLLPNLPILGEVPFDNEIEKNKLDKRGVTAESSRVIRSNISFLLNDKQKTSIMLVTSTTKGEGKSFVSYNLAESYSSLGKKVLLLGADLRNPQLHKSFNVNRDNLGLSTYLNDEKFTDLDSLIIKNVNSENLDCLLSGAIPPNPSELLMRPRMKDLLDELRLIYDIIIIDSAPLLLVSDTSSLLPLADLLVYVTRAQFTDKNIIPYIKEVQNRNKSLSIGMVLNGLISGANGYGYSYRYSYSYKYNYGYSYGYSQDKQS